MRFHVYEEGGGEPDATDAIGDPRSIAEHFVAEYLSDRTRPVNVIVEALDQDAGRFGKWHTPEDGERDEEGFRPFRMFVVKPIVAVEYDTREVQTFNPHAKADR